MLILTRRIGEGIKIGDDISVRVLSSREGQISLGIKAPDEIEVHRDEIYERIQYERIQRAKLLNFNGEENRNEY